MLNSDAKIIKDMLQNTEYLNYVNGTLEDSVKNIAGNDIDIIIGKSAFCEFINKHFDEISKIKICDFSKQQFIVYVSNLSVPIHFHIGLSFYGSAHFEFSEIFKLHSENNLKCADLFNQIYHQYRYKPKLVKNYQHSNFNVYKNRYLRFLYTLYQSENKFTYSVHKFWKRKTYVVLHGVDGSGKSTLALRLSRKLDPSRKYYFGLRRLYIVRLWSKVKRQIPRKTDGQVIQSYQTSANVTNLKKEILVLVLVCEYFIRFLLLKVFRFSGFIIVDRSPVDILFSKFRNTWIASHIFRLFPYDTIHLLIEGEPSIISKRGAEYDQDVTKQMQENLRRELMKNVENLTFLSCNSSEETTEKYAVIEIINKMLKS